MAHGLFRYLIGTITFLVAVPMFLIGGLVGVINPAVSRFPPAVAWIFLGLGAFLAATGAYLWYRAVAVTPGDDVLSDDRGTIVSLMVITALILAAGTLYFALNPDFWRGALEGVLD
jgi:hypothetical protein